MAEITEFYYNSANGKNKIRAKKYIPETTIKGIVQIAHGIAEHIDRYDTFMTFLADNGYIAVANDHLGHGKSISGKEDLGAFSENDGWNTVVKDMVSLHDTITAEYSGVPYVMFGHSMGSFLTRTYIIDYPDKYDAVIISGTGHQSSLMVTAGKLLSKFLVRKNGYRSDGKQLNDIAFGSYLNKIENPKTDFDWLSTDDSTVKKYIDDPYCGFIAQTGLYADMMTGSNYVTNMNNIRRMNLDKPVYFMSGKEDPVGEYGKGVEKAYNCFKIAGVKDVMIRLYPGGRHEMLNETNSTVVFNDILNWLNAKVCKG